MLQANVLKDIKFGAVVDYLLDNPCWEVMIHPGTYPDGEHPERWTNTIAKCHRDGRDWSLGFLCLTNEMDTEKYAKQKDALNRSMAHMMAMTPEERIAAHSNNDV